MFQKLIDKSTTEMVLQTETRKSCCTGFLQFERGTIKLNGDLHWEQEKNEVKMIWLIRMMHTLPD